MFLGLKLIVRVVFLKILVVILVILGKLPEGVGVLKFNVGMSVRAENRGLKNRLLSNLGSTTVVFVQFQALGTES